jgi:hypothetical protein
MKALREQDILRIMREEWDKKVSALSETIDVVLKGKIENGEEPKTLLSPELKVMHKKSGIRYTVDSVGPRDVILRTPEGDKFIVSAEDLEQGYHLD